MPEYLPLGAALVLVAFAERGWRKRPLRRETDAMACRIMWTITAVGLGLSLAIWAAVLLIEPSLFGAAMWIGGLAWLLATVATGRFAMWPVAWRVADSGVPGGALPAAVLWGASACVWFGVFRLVGAVINLATGIVDIPLDALLFLLGGFGVLERSRGWRICLVVLWASIGLVGLVLMGQSLLAIGGVGRAPVLRAGTSELDSPGLAVVFGCVLGLIGLSLATTLCGASVRGWCVGRTQAGNACAKCGYNLKGIENKVCPECGVDARPAS
jgi:hypothetical protein